MRRPLLAALPPQDLLGLRLVVVSPEPLALAGRHHAQFVSPGVAVGAAQLDPPGPGVSRHAAVLRGAAAPPLGPADGVGHEVGREALARAHQLLDGLGAAAGSVCDVAGGAKLPAAQLRGTWGEERGEFSVGLRLGRTGAPPGGWKAGIRGAAVGAGSRSAAQISRICSVAECDVSVSAETVCAWRSDGKRDRGLESGGPAGSNQLIANAEQRPIKQLHQTMWNLEPRGKAGARRRRPRGECKPSSRTDAEDCQKRGGSVDPLPLQNKGFMSGDVLRRT